MKSVFYHIHSYKLNAIINMAKFCRYALYWHISTLIYALYMLSLSGRKREAFFAVIVYFILKEVKEWIG